jgi:tRNA modification GTPase
MARPGEFTERAFLNGKLDLAQAEGISDLINASSKSAARSASLSMQGEFSFQVREIVEDIIEMRKFVEACIDFPAEDIDFLDNRDLKKRLVSCIKKLNLVIKRAHQGRILQEGINVALTGKPNAGKSTLFNLLTGYDSAIVTSTPGTTRDVLREKVLINDVPIFLSDSAGLRESDEEIEKEGIRRAEEEIKAADVVLYIVDCSNGSVNQELAHLLPGVLKLCSDGSLFAVVFNKIDMFDFKKSDVSHCLYPFHFISAKEGLGINELKNFITDLVGLDEIVEGVFSARKRHLIALGEALKFIEIGKKQLNNTGSGELLAEDLKSAQNNLSSIVGSYSPDDLLGEIFSSFCIGK